MKHFLLLLLIFTTTLYLYAEEQCDVILTTTNFQIPCTITSIDSSSVQYLKCPIANDYEPVIINVSEIKKVYLSDGRIIDYTKEQVSTLPQLDCQPIVAPVAIEQQYNAFAEESTEQTSSTQPQVNPELEKHVKTLISPYAIDSQTIATGTSHDIIITADSRKIDAKIVEVSKNEIRYKELDNLDGPIFVLEVIDINSVIFSNGKVVLYNHEEYDAKQKVMAGSNSQNVPEVPAQDNFECNNMIKDWHHIVDWICFENEVDIRDFDVIYLYPIDGAKIIWPDEDDNRYPALIIALKKFPYLIKEELEDEFNHIHVAFVDDSYIPNSNTKALILRLRFNELYMGSRAARFWVGFGAGSQSIAIAGYVADVSNNKHFSFKHRRLTSRGINGYEKCLLEEFENFAEDIKDIFNQMSEDIKKEHRRKR